MKLEFADRKLERAASHSGQIGRWPAKLIEIYRRRIAVIKAAKDRRDLYALSSLHLEKLKGQRRHQHSVKLDGQFRIVLQFRKEDKREIVTIVDIEDYHK